MIPGSPAKGRARRLAALSLCFILAAGLSGCGEDGAETVLDIAVGLYELASSHAVSVPQSAWYYSYRKDMWHGAYSGEAVLAVNNDIPGFSLKDLSAAGLYGVPVSESAGLGRNLSVTAVLPASGEAALPWASSGGFQAGDPALPGWDRNVPYIGTADLGVFRQASMLPDGSGGRVLATAYAWSAGLRDLYGEAAAYPEASGATVLWRLTAVYDGPNLMPEGFLVECQASDGGLYRCRYVYNVQPGIAFDYATGRSWPADGPDPEASAPPGTGASPEPSGDPGVSRR